MDHPGRLDAGLPGVPSHGANLGTGERLRAAVLDPNLGGLDVFLPGEWLSDRETLGNIAARVLSPAFRGTGRLAFHAVEHAARVLSDGVPRILIAGDPEDYPAVRHLRDRFATAPTAIVVLTHGLGHRGCHEALERLRGACPGPDVIVCLSRALETALRRGHPWVDSDRAPFRLARVGNGVETVRFAPTAAPSKRALRAKFGIPPSAVVGIVQGRLTARGKADLLPVVDAFAAIQPSGGERLWFVGDSHPPGYAESVMAYAERLGIGGRILHTPAVPMEQRHEPLAASDFLILPSDTVQEAHPNIVGEAMATGLPILASHWDGLTDWIDHDVEGLLVPTWSAPIPERLEGAVAWHAPTTHYLFAAAGVVVDPVALRSGLAKLYRDRELRLRLGAAARRRAQSMPWSDIHRQWMGEAKRSLDDAFAEHSTVREQRRVEARARAGFPAEGAFDHYASIPPTDWRSRRVRATETGRGVLAGSVAFPLDDALVPALIPEILQAWFTVLDDGSGLGHTVDGAAAEVSHRAGRSIDEVLWHLAVLSKHGLTVVESGGEPANQGTQRCV
ncbi:MAG: glycosyltransferase family 4 protein [Armatimonadota bacterium]